MSGPKRNPDKLNTIGVVVVGVCGAVLVYVSIIALQAFYMNDSSEVQTMADYGGQDTTVKSIRTTQLDNISAYAPNPPPAPPKAGDPPGVQTYRVPIDRAIKLVVESAKVDPSMLVPTQGRSDKRTIEPMFGRPKIAPPPAAPAPAAPAGEGSAVTPPLTPTGGQGMGGGAPPGTEGAAPAPAPAKAPAAAPAKTPAKTPVPKPGATGSAAKGNAP